MTDAPKLCYFVRKNVHFVEDVIDVDCCRFVEMRRLVLAQQHPSQCVFSNRRKSGNAMEDECYYCCLKCCCTIVVDVNLKRKDGCSLFAVACVLSFVTHVRVLQFQFNPQRATL